MSPRASGAHRRAMALVERGLADQDALAATVSPGEREVLGELHAWSIKDQIAHNNFWRQDAVWRLQAALDGTTPQDTSDDLAENDRVFQEQRDTPWDELVTETQRLRSETTALIERLGPDDLSRKDRYPWQGGGSLETLILINWYDHPAEHWADVYLGRRQVDRALELRKEVATTVGELYGRDSKMYSYMAYKLGGIQARNGRPQLAIDSVREALTANPSLIDSVRKDADLDPLRSLPAFRSLA